MPVGHLVMFVINMNMKTLVHSPAACGLLQHSQSVYHDAKNVIHAAATGAAAARQRGAPQAVNIYSFIHSNATRAFWLMPEVRHSG